MKKEFKKGDTAVYYYPDNYNAYGYNVDYEGGGGFKKLLTIGRSYIIYNIFDYYGDNTNYGDNIRIKNDGGNIIWYKTEHFITLSEWRERLINNILNEIERIGNR